LNIFIIATIAISSFLIFRDPFPILSLTADNTNWIFLLQKLMLKDNLDSINGFASIEITFPFGEAKARVENINQY